MRDDSSIIKLLETLHNRFDDFDENSYDNTMIQYFSSPHDTATLTTMLQTYLNGTSITTSPSETTTMNASITPNVTDPSTLTWGGYDTNGVFHNAGWSWGVGGTWK
ncbi:hypothetical protein O9H85_08120 [Paenibacillus filicis]|uniref:Uncharacterized protein n=1 Tax=Paenibacillus gyeongsangnamensis TaxID=3388067 RepID=A0ABT4Q6F5_9BACL|nr:hypothetical protein [Paenibacillus filicis]MCZ8512398.1 hypothetical protein [Paenibacillus filicis]